MDRDELIAKNKEAFVWKSIMNFLSDSHLSLFQYSQENAPNIVNVTWLKNELESGCKKLIVQRKRARTTKRNFLSISSRHVSGICESIKRQIGKGVDLNIDFPSRKRAANKFSSDSFDNTFSKDVKLKTPSLETNFHVFSFNFHST